MVVNYNVDADLIKPVRQPAKETEEVALIREFLESDNTNISFTYEDEDAARKKRNNIATHCKKKDLPVKALLRKTSVIVIKVTPSND